MRLFTPNTTILDEQGATGVGTAFNVKPFRNIVIAVSAAVNSSLTFKFQGSIGTAAGSDDSPNFAAAQTIANHWDYIEAFDHQNTGTAIAGDTGVTLNNDTVAGNTRLYKINVDLLEWVNIEVTSWTDGDFSAFVVGASD